MTTPSPDRIELESPGKLSQSVLWDLQGRFYQERGVSSWNTGLVPHHITSSPATAEAYVELVAAYLADLDTAGCLDPTRPFPVVELGAGCGRFGFQFLRHWARRAATTLPPLRYLMTDFCLPNLEHLRNHPRLQPFVERQMLDFALFDARSLEPGGLVDGGPMVLIANYIFDTLPQESFAVREGQLYGTSVRVTVPREVGIEDPEVLSSVQVAWEDGPALDDCGLDDKLLATIVERYEETLPDTRFLLPVAALRCLRHFQQASNGDILVLVADKGDLHEWQLQFGDAPKMELHGSFSLPVNFHAIGQYVAELGAEVFAPVRTPDNLVVTGYVFSPGGRRPCTTAFARTFSSIIGRRGPDELFTVLEGLSAAGGPKDLGTALATLALSNYDPAEFKVMLPALVEFGRSVPDFRRPDVHRALLSVWDGYFSIGEPDDLAFGIGAVLCSIGYHAEAMDFYDRSIDLLGPEPDVLFSRALCQFHLRKLEDALKGIDAALALDPGLSGARSLRVAISAELEAAGPSW
jgi:hypothetical protein